MSLENRIVELEERGYCVLKDHYPRPLIDACSDAFQPVLSRYLEANRDQPNRGLNRHFLPMPFEPPCFAPEFFFDRDVLKIVHHVMDNRIVADQWGCDVPLRGSTYQHTHADYQRPLFPEAPDLLLPPYMLVVSFGLIDIAAAHGPIEIAPGTHRLPRKKAIEAIESARVKLQPVPLSIGDVLIRHPWALHRGSPNTTDVPRALVTIRYVRSWYADDSREVNAIPAHVWHSLTQEQRQLLRFPGAD